MAENTVKLIDEAGRIVLPKEIRHAMNWSEKIPVQIWLNTSNDEIILKKHQKLCAFCGKDTNTKEYQRQFICSSCIEAINHL